VTYQLLDENELKGIASNWNVGILECWNTGFWNNSVMAQWQNSSLNNNKWITSAHVSIFHHSIILTSSEAVKNFSIVHRQKNINSETLNKFSEQLRVLMKFIRREIKFKLILPF
jgi:hypothetical protein